MCTAWLAFAPQALCSISDTFATGCLLHACCLACCVLQVDVMPFLARQPDTDPFITQHYGGPFEKYLQALSNLNASFVRFAPWCPNPRLVVPELTPPDCSNNANALLASAETSVLSLNDALTQACVLRLGGIYGPGKDIPSYIRSAAGQPVRKNGNHINAWVHLLDIVRGVDFAFGRSLQGIYNLVDDLQFTRRQLSNALCDDFGLPPVIWDNHDRPGARIFNARVSNARLRAIGFLSLIHI